MRAYARVRQVTEAEYGELKRWERSRTMAAGKVKRARAVLHSNQGYTHAEVAQRLEMIDAHGKAVGDALQQVRHPGVRRGAPPRTPASLYRRTGGSGDRDSVDEA